MINNRRMFILPAAWVALALVLIGVSLAHAGEVVTSRHYKVYSDLDPDFTDDLITRLDAMYDEYARRMSDFSQLDPDSRSSVHIFAKRADYTKFTGNRVPNTGGVFMSHENALAAFLEGQGRDGLRRTLQHEAFHQFAHNSISRDLPVWLNEGMAQVFEEGLWTGERFWIGHVPPRRVRQLQFDMQKRRLLDFKDFITMSHEQWAKTLADDPDRGAARYNQAWAMVHYLVYGGDEANQYRERLLKMLDLIHNGANGQDAFEQSFSDNYRGFQERFLAWAKDLQPTKEAALIERHEILSDMLAEFAQAGTTFRTISEFKDYAIKTKIVLKYRKGDMQWQSDPNPGTYFANAKTLRFEKQSGQLLPDLIATSGDRFQLRTRFVGTKKAIEKEVLLEPAVEASARSE